MTAMALTTADTGEWHSLVNANFPSLQCQFARPTNFRASARAQRFADVLAAELSVDASRVIRLQRDADADLRAYFKVLWQLSGECRIEQGTRQSLLRPGCWSVYDTRRSYSIESIGHANFVVLLVPQDPRHGWSSTVETLAGQALDAQGTPRVVLAGLAAILRDDALPDAEGQQLLEDSTVMLLEHALLRSAARFPALGPETRKMARLADAQDWIRRHLHNTTLSPDTVARAMNLSRRSLYNLFLAARTTPRAFIQQERMALACRLLGDPARPHMPVHEVAARCGFADPAHFSRAFAGARGCSPTSWRALAR
jgi:AraC family transcriptional activator of tynA and feaB